MSTLARIFHRLGIVAAVLGVIAFGIVLVTEWPELTMTVPANYKPFVPPERCAHESDASDVACFSYEPTPDDVRSVRAKARDWVAVLLVVYAAPAAALFALAWIVRPPPGKEP